MKNFFSLLLAINVQLYFYGLCICSEPYAENSNPPTLQDTLQEILDNPTYSNAYKEAAKKKCDYLMSVRDSGPSALTRASNSMTIYVPHTAPILMVLAVVPLQCDKHWLIMVICEKFVHNYVRE